MAGSVYSWSTVFANNGTADGDVPWPEGMARRQVNDSARGIMGRVAALLVDIGGSLSAGGTANGLTVTASNAFTVYADGLIISFRATADNTGAATLNVNGIGAKAIRKMDSTGDVALVAGEIQQTGIYVAQYSAALNGAAGAWLLVNPTLSAALYALAGLVTVDNTIPRFDGIAGKIQTSGVVISDTNVVTGGAWNGTVGATTPATISGTTGSFSGNVTTTAQFLASPGALSAPSYSFNGDTNSGITNTANTNVQVVVNASQILVATSNNVTINGTLTVTG